VRAPGLHPAGPGLRLGVLLADRAARPARLRRPDAADDVLRPPPAGTRLLVEVVHAPGRGRDLLALRRRRLDPPLRPRLHRMSLRLPLLARLGAAVALGAGMLALAGCGDSAPNADLEAGKQNFVNLCSSCHTLQDAGRPPSAVGPDLDDAFRAA